MMMWPHSAPWLWSPSIDTPSTMMPQPMPVPSVNITMLCSSRPAPTQNSPYAAAARVVGERDRQAAVVAHPIADRKIVPARQIDRAEQHSRRHIHRAGRTEADAPHFAQFDTGLADGVKRTLAHPLGPAFGTLLDGRGNGDIRKRTPVIIDHTDLAAGAPQIDADIKRRPGLIARNVLP